MLDMVRYHSAALQGDYCVRQVVVLFSSLSPVRCCFRYYHDLMDFAVVDTLMYHYDTKHYIIYDHSDAHGLTVRLDHGRA